MGTANQKNYPGRILITGITGFAGSYLAELLHGSDNEIHGVSRSGKWPSDITEKLKKIPLHTCTLQDPEHLSTILKKINPTHVYHLAGFAQTNKSFVNPGNTWQGNLGATQTLYEAIKKSGCSPRILFAGSGLVYGSARYDLEIKTETSELMPESPYASSKAAADLLSYQVWKTDGIEIIRARPFNHIGPRQSTDFAIASFSKQIAEIELLGKPPIIKTGPLSAFRDLTDVRDTVRAYQKLMEHGKPGEAYNIGSGKNTRISDALKTLISISKFPKLEFEEESKGKTKNNDQQLIVGIQKLKSSFEWKPAYSIHETLTETLNYWRLNISGQLQNPKEAK